MRIDDSSKIDMLAESMPGMSDLNFLLIVIWQELEAIPTRILHTKEGSTYYYNKVKNEFSIINQTK